MSSSDESIADQEFTKLSAIYAKIVGSFVEHGQPYALMDFPSYWNIGDSAIWLGQLKFFDKHVRKPPTFVNTCLDDPIEVNRHMPEGPIFIQGGGNFGDIWKNHQSFRYRVWDKLKGRPVVQLPQSIHFDDPKNRDLTARAIEEHGQFTLIVRDQKSYDLAYKHFNCPVEMSPDAAVNLHYIPSAKSTGRVKSFLRDDKEASWESAREILSRVGDTNDWPIVNTRRFKHRIKQRILSVSPTSAMRNLEKSFREQAETRLSAGVESIQTARVIVTDRLHVHLVSSLMRRPNIVMDNRYGKISRHISAWSSFGLARPVLSIEELLTELASFEIV